jgi:glutamate synthase domain-containing protein 3
MGMVGFEELSQVDAVELRAMVEEHMRRTDSPVARDVLDRFDELLAAGAFVKVMPHDYKRVLRELAEAETARAVTHASGNGAAHTVAARGGQPLDAVGASEPEEESA